MLGSILYCPGCGYLIHQCCCVAEDGDEGYSEQVWNDDGRAEVYLEQEQVPSPTQGEGVQ